MIKKAFKIIKIMVMLAFIPLFLILLSNYSIEKRTQGKTYIDTSKIPKNKVGLVLGTAKFLRNGTVNLYFKYRIDATVKLYQSGKIDFVLVSGDNSRTAYDEPTDFKDELVKKWNSSRKNIFGFCRF